MALKGVSFVQMIPSATEMVAGLTRFAGSLRSLRDPLEEAVDGVLRPEVEEAFASEGPGWESLKDVTIRDRRRLGFADGPILTRSGNLRSVATSKRIWEFDGQSGEAFVTDLPGAEYGFAHELGLGVPQRSFMGVSDEGMDQIEEIFENFISANAAKFVASGYAVGGALRGIGARVPRILR